MLYSRARILHSARARQELRELADAQEERCIEPCGDQRRRGHMTSSHACDAETRIWPLVNSTPKDACFLGLSNLGAPSVSGRRLKLEHALLRILCCKCLGSTLRLSTAQMRTAQWQPGDTIVPQEMQ